MRVSLSTTGESRKGAGSGERAGTDYVGEGGVEDVWMEVGCGKERSWNAEGIER